MIIVRMRKGKPMTTHVDVKSADDCYAVGWSFGEICVNCECCSDDPIVRIKSRILYHQEMAEDALKDLAEGAKDMSERQLINSENLLRYHQEMADYYGEELEKMKNGKIP